MTPVRLTTSLAKWNTGAVRSPVGDGGRLRQGSFEQLGRVLQDSGQGHVVPGREFDRKLARIRYSSSIADRFGDAFGQLSLLIGNPL